MMKKARFLGYPINQKSQLVGFYKWLYGSGFNLSMINAEKGSVAKGSV